MAFVKGHKKVPGSGRKKGQTCRLAADVRAKLQELGFDPIVGMVTIAQDPDCERAIVVRVAAELAQYVYPKRRSVEISGIDGAAIEVNDNSSAIESLKARIAGIASRIGEKPTT